MTFQRVYIEIAIVRCTVKNALKSPIVVQLVVLTLVQAPQIVKLLTTPFLTPFIIVEVQFHHFNSAKLLVYETWDLGARVVGPCFHSCKQTGDLRVKPPGFPLAKNIAHLWNAKILHVHNHSPPPPPLSNGDW